MLTVVKISMRGALQSKTVKEADQILPQSFFVLFGSEPVLTRQ